MTETIKVSESLELHAVAENHVTPLYQLICKNKTWLQQSLNWPQFVQSEEDTRKTVQGNVMLHQRGYAKMFMIFKEDELIGVISFNRIEPLNKTAEIGYCVFRSIRSRIGIEVRSAIRIHSINRELNFFYRFLTR
ncbi:50S ribosomal protein L7/L12-serine acetyltransferase, partial [Escherichia coli]|nr:50S ribosomal protein L7/L12-serine acetyltransferase [Escherichia coli]MDY8484555.1 50S ribosomal protein L7/L12-serine acetyltransferase [Escherichia coli]MDY8525966.1 50S ribosomal protein L7/L12-serine acetyltransferase [Escherichia coli]MDY8539508.1 50S ribosomal protein L7/L12-serine acetyltransferase [Escherichia coli]MDY8594485.1 50S ribosomal protein L7/L12-serine acetyltransferase [Escherichia coli]